MKKLILCLLMVASYGLVNAANAVETPKVGEASEPATTETVEPIVICVSLKNMMACGAGETQDEALTSLCYSLGGATCD